MKIIFILTNTIDFYLLLYAYLFFSNLNKMPNYKAMQFLFAFLRQTNIWQIYY
jgi:hypothetical protein